MSQENRIMHNTLVATVIAAAIAGSTAAPAAQSTPATPRFDAGTISGLGARNIGSATMSGRVAAIAAVNEKNGKLTLYVGAASGGVWKSPDGGTTFEPVFDKQDVASIGAIAIDPKEHDTVWVGTGEAWTRNSVSIGDGIYKTTDGGKSWTNMGLPKSERIAKILIDPSDSNTVYACVPGRLWSDSADRGLYKTSDGGKSWNLVLKGGNLSTGCAMATLDPAHPGTLYASLWDFRRKGWTFRSGGPSPDATSGSGLFKSTDGGRTWTEFKPETHAGFPKKPYGRIAVSAAPSQPDTVYAFVESTDSALFRSDDGGKTWTKRDKSQSMVWRPFYFANLIVDPTNPDRVFKPNLSLIMSSDGGNSFAPISGGAHGDFHDVWINPANPQHLIAGDDGGLWYSQDGGNKWWKADNLPISQFYHVSVDMADPFRVYGGLQDNSSWVGQSDYPGGITNSRWENMYGGDGFWMFADPADPDYLYAEYQGGEIGRVNRHTHQIHGIKPQAGYKEKLRFNWNTPMALSPNENGTLYIGSQFLFRSRDHGMTWERISPDLTSNDPAKQRQEESGGVTVDNSAAEMHTTIYSISESPKQAGLIWVGTDDGNVQLTRDGGRHWTNVVKNIKGVPEHAWVSWVQAGNFDAGTAYVAFDRHTFGDFAPYLYKTTDYGQTWTALVTPAAPKGLHGYAHVIKEDTVAPNLLFAGTEFGLWISIDGGASWAQFKGGSFPAVAVRDLAIHPRDGDLVLGTHGRGIWIVDDIAPLRALSAKVLGAEAAFLASRPVQQRIGAFGGWPEGDAKFTGATPPDGAVITYYQKSRHLFGKLKLEVLDADGKVIDELPGSVRRGINRVVWSMRVKPPRVPPAAQVAGNATQGPRVMPGEYTVRLTKGDKTYETRIKVGLDARANYSLEDRKAQYDAAMRVHGMFGAMTDLLFRINAVRGAVAQHAAKVGAKDPLAARLKTVGEQADTLRKEIVATKEGGAITGEERLREHLDNLYGAIMSWEGRPTAYQLERIEVLQREIDDVAARFESFRQGSLARLNAELKAQGAPEIAIPEAVPATVGAQAGRGRDKSWEID